MKQNIFFFFFLYLSWSVFAQQSSTKVMMVRPANFGYNIQTAQSNAFQHMPTEADSLVQQKALVEFDNAVSVLKEKGVDVFVVEDTQTPIKPDAIFPNNWISFNPDGRIFVYPMLSTNRREEKRIEIIKDFYKTTQIPEIIDWSKYENNNQYLEGTGSVVFDHLNKILFACISPRTNSDLVTLLANTLHYKAVIFNAIDENKKEIYHTNVMMCIGSNFAVVCSESIANKKEREIVLKNLRVGNKKIIKISLEQMKNFLGNMLEVKTKQGKTLIVLSQTAFNRLQEVQKVTLSKFGELTPINIPTIEKVGGGSARCMIAQILRE
ncbi:MAG: arginine deiminase-related protein [Chitinophagaceae bacterium]|nr:arginine deiminase-related protein [Chitinophagaceae bacterium]